MLNFLDKWLSYQRNVGTPDCHTTALLILNDEYISFLEFIPVSYNISRLTYNLLFKTFKTSKL
jgi:hypothetical protein